MILLGDIEFDEIFSSQARGFNGGLAAAWVDDYMPSLIGRELDIYSGKNWLKSKNEFTSGRHCIRMLQETLNLPLKEVLPGSHGPKWPDGIVGSISHSKTLASAILLTNVKGVGIDIEENERVGLAHSQRIATEKERLRYVQERDFDWTLLFSAKESLFKALNPISRQYFGFQAVEVEFDFKKRTFQAIPTRPLVEGSAIERSFGFWAKSMEQIIVITVLE